MDNITLAYLAGFFDGEGCVYILRHRRSGRTDQHSLEISFTGSEREPLELAQEMFRGCISTSFDPRPDRKTVSRLRIRAKQAALALSLMLPYLRVKKERAEIGIEFQSLLSKPGHSKERRIPLDLAEQYKARITSMNDKVWNRGKSIA